MEIIERIASFLADIIAIISGAVMIKQKIIKGKWAKTFVGIIVVVAGIVNVAFFLYFIKTQVFQTREIVQNASTNIIGNNYEIINNYYSGVAGGGNNENDNISTGGVSDITESLTDPQNILAGSDSGRETYSLEEINNGASGDKITFNSIVFEDSDYEWYEATHDGKSIPVGVIQDERNFVGARENTGKNEGAMNIWNGDEIKVEDGKTYFVRLYVNNNGPNGKTGASENTRVKFYVPTESANTITIKGLIKSSNAVPSEYWDYVNFTSDIPFHLEYINDSASLCNNFYTHTDTVDNSYKLDDELITGADGVLIGYDVMNGIVPGGYQFDCYIVICVKAVYDYR